MANGINWWEPGGIFSPKESFGREQYGLLGPEITTPTLLGSGIFGQTGGGGCQFGYHKNAAGNCVPDTTTDGCPAGQARNAAGQCVPISGACPTGQTRDASGNCVPITSDGGCPPGQRKNAAGVCVPITTNGGCPPGQAKNSAGVCESTGPSGRCTSGPRRGLMPHPVYGCGSAPVSELCQSGPRAGMAPHPVYGCSDTGEQPCPDGSRPNVHTGKCDELGVDRCWDGMPPEADGTCNRRGTVQVTTQQGLADAPSGEFMPGGGVSPSSYLGADPTWGVERTGLTGNVGYVDPWQATRDPTTGLLRSSVYDDPNVNPQLQSILDSLRDTPVVPNQSLLDFGGTAPALSGADAADVYRASQSSAAADRAKDEAREAAGAAARSGDSGDQRKADEAQDRADKAEKRAADDKVSAAKASAAIAADARAARAAQAAAEAKTARDAAAQRANLDAASKAAMKAHQDWMATQAKRLEDEEKERAKKYAGGTGGGLLWT